MASSLATHDWLVLDGPAGVVGYAYGSAYRSQPVGTWRRIGWKFGAWHDVLWMQRPLAPGSEPPAEPS